MSDLATLEQRAKSELEQCPDEAAVRAWHGRYLGKTGALQEFLKNIATVPKEERPAFGKEVNRVKEELTQAYEAALEQKKGQALELSLAAEALDVTLPGRAVPRGRLHV